MKINIKIEVNEISVSESYFGFIYIVLLNGVRIESGEYSDSHSRNSDINIFKKELEEGYAYQLIIDSLEIGKIK